MGKGKFCTAFALGLLVMVLATTTTTTDATAVRKIILTDKVVIPAAPYSQAVRVDNMLYVSGMLGLTKDGEMVPGIENQTRQVLNSIGYVLQDAGSSFDRVVQANIYVSDMDNYATVNSIYGEYFTRKYPARAAVQVGRIPRDGLVEIDVVAIVGEVIDI